MSFTVTKHNLDYVLDQYKGGREPKTIVMPYDHFGLEVEDRAPPRSEVQQGLFEYDLREKLGNQNLGLTFTGWVGQLHAVDVNGRTKFDDDKSSIIQYHGRPIGPGMVIYSSARGYMFDAKADKPGDLERVTSVMENDLLSLIDATLFPQARRHPGLRTRRFACGFELEEFS